jgi:hypothetical protein
MPRFSDRSLSLFMSLCLSQSVLILVSCLKCSFCCGFDSELAARNSILPSITKSEITPVFIFLKDKEVCIIPKAFTATGKKEERAGGGVSIEKRSNETQLRAGNRRRQVVSTTYVSAEKSHVSLIRFIVRPPRAIRADRWRRRFPSRRHPLRRRRRRDQTARRPSARPHAAVRGSVPCVRPRNRACWRPTRRATTLSRG